MTGGWQPIATAPKDGTRILLFRDNRIDCGSFIENAFGASFWQSDGVGNNFARSQKPSHWQPLPASPEPPMGVPFG